MCSQSEKNVAIHVMSEWGKGRIL